MMALGPRLIAAASGLRGCVDWQYVKWPTYLVTHQSMTQSFDTTALHVHPCCREPRRSITE